MSTQNGSSLSQSFAKAFTKNASWPDKEELLDIVYWGRQILALLLGVVCGILPIKGFFGLILYVAVSTLAGQAYLVQYQSQDEEEYGGFWELAKEGFGAAFATFMVSWITVYSVIHFD